MARWKVAGLVLLAGIARAEVAIYPLSEVRAGQRGTGRTVFEGARIEEFGVEILGVLENAGPKQSMVLARLSGGPIERTGVLQGMSGSPVYIEGRLLGALAMAFPFSKESIAGIRPIEEMLRAAPAARREGTQGRVALTDRQLTHVFADRGELRAGESRLVDIATPITFGGFTRGTIEQFAPQLRALGLEPSQGMTGGGRVEPKLGDASWVQPGSMISVQLLSGDMSVGAEGTVTHVEGKRIYAFGHRFLSVGETELPFARAEVLTLLPNLATSFKISAAREWMGAITADHSAGVAGELGRRAAMVPLSLEVMGRPRSTEAPRQFSYRMEMVNDRFLTPFLLQLAVYAAMDATERTLGLGSLAVRGQFEFQDGTAPVRLNNMYAGEGNVPMQVSLATAVPLAYVMQSGIEGLKLKSVSLAIEVFEEKRQMLIDQVWPSQRTVQPGETLELAIALVGENGAEQVRKVKYTVPIGAPTGKLNFTVADGTTTNLSEYQHLIGMRPRSAEQVVSFLNGLRSNTGAYVRVWRPEAGFQVQGQSLPAPPSSVKMILGRSQAAVGGTSPAQMSKVAEIGIQAGDVVITGSKTIQVEVTE